MQHPCKHCAQHHTNSMNALHSSSNRFRQSEQHATIPITPTTGASAAAITTAAAATPKTSSVYPESRAMMTMRKKDRSITTSPAATVTKMPLNVFINSSTKQSDSSIILDQFHRTIVNISRTDRYSNDRDNTLLVPMENKLQNAEYSVCNDYQIISISGARRQSHVCRTVACASTPQIQPPITCIQKKTVHLGSMHELTSTIGATTEVALNSPISSVGLVPAIENPVTTSIITPVTMSVLPSCSQRKPPITLTMCKNSDQLRNNGFELHRKRVRWALTMTSLTTFSHVLLFCLVFAAFSFGSQNGMVYANDQQKSLTNITKFTELGSKYHILFTN